MEILKKRNVINIFSFNCNFEKIIVKTSHSKKPVHEPEDENMEYYFYSQNNNRDKKLKVALIFFLLYNYA